MADHDRPHIDISALVRRGDYKSPNTNGRINPLQRIRADHGGRIAAEIRTAFEQADISQTSLVEGSPELEPSGGVYLEIELSRSVGAKDIERKTEKTRQSAEIVSDEGVRTVALFVPDGARDTLNGIIADYTEGEITSEKGTPPKATRIEPIEHIRMARLRTFWRDDQTELPTDPQAEIWWGLWCFSDRLGKVLETAEKLGLQLATPDNYLHFPEVVVVPAFGRVSAIELLLFASGGIAELRRANDNPAVFTSSLDEDAAEFIEDLAERITWPGNNAPAVCLLDTGVNRAHPLIEPALSLGDLLSVNAEWGGDDHYAGHGHGTGMAGLALHGDLVAPLADNNHRTLRHRIESVKILPPDGFPENEPHSYGSITQSAIAQAEIQNPERSRIFCMAITNRNRSGAEPSAWSAAIDQASAGSELNDLDNMSPKRLLVVYAGNVSDTQYITTGGDIDANPSQDPCQAWNALTVGGFTQKTDITEPDYEDWATASAVGEASPYSTSSILWDTSKSPFKPELVLEAGNRAISLAANEVMSGLDSISLLTTSKDVDVSPLAPFWATSAATAQAARMAAQLSDAYPHYWPETIRALMIHSAQWTPPMMNAIDGVAAKKDKADFIRRYGYGVPDLSRASASAIDNLALVAQNEIQPFRKEGSIRFNQAHVYELPWPLDLLEQLDNTPVRLKLTLSYFVEPNPSFASAIDPARYQSFGLRFDLKRSLETTGDFHRRNNADANFPGSAAASTPDGGWLFGTKQISSGSVHMDIWDGVAVELAARNQIYIRPINGWWRERKALGRFEGKARYALIVSLETPDNEIDLYTPIEALVPTLIPIKTGF